MRKLLILIFTLLNTLPVFSANSASTELSFTILPFLNITPLTNTVLIANVSDRTGNTYQPLYVKYRVVSNIGEGTTLYLSSTAHTEDGEEISMFSLGGRAYVAFTYVTSPASHYALENCKYGNPDSPKVIAYPIISVSGAPVKFKGNKYEVNIKNGTYFIDVVLGSHVLPSSFNRKDPLGFYKATITLTESDI